MLFVIIVTVVSKVKNKALIIHTYVVNTVAQKHHEWAYKNISGTIIIVCQ